MAIRDYSDEGSFGKDLNKLLSPSSPISSIEFLHGRSDELRQIEKALMVKGRNIFIFGERGVGKTSLAKTAANQYQSSDREHIDVSCATDTTIKSLIANIAIQAINKKFLNNKKRTEELSVKYKWLSYTIRNEDVLDDLSSKIKTLSDCVEILKEVANFHSQRPIVVVDEVDRLTDTKEIELLADLIKQIGDKEVSLKFIFTGVGSTIHEILGSHQSAIRQLETIELSRLSWEGRFEIIQSALHYFKVDIHRDIYMRIAAVSDGFPYYVHLILEKLMWILWEKPEVVSDVDWEDFYNALNAAIKGSVAEFSKSYELALQQRTKDYEEVLWAIAAVDWQGDYIADMYKMYKVIFEHLKEMEDRSPKLLNSNQFSTRIKNLTKKNYGHILVPKYQQGFYTFREKMMRGYIRMQAEANRIEIAVITNEKNISNIINIPSKRNGYYRSVVPKGIKFKSN